MTSGHLNKFLEIQNQLERILPSVQKPGRYTGGELNQIIKDWSQIQIKIALVFPDIYDIGMSNLGMAILYDTINQRLDTLAERSFSPWIDMEAVLRQRNLPLYSLETKHPLAEFDIIGISLPYETLFTNTLNILDLSGIPLLTTERQKNHPLVIAGGHAAFNPEPMHAFIDAFVIGEGEEVIHEIIDAYKNWKNNLSSRSQLLTDLSRIWGVYIPSLYEAHYNTDHTFSNLEKFDKNAPLPILKRIVPKLPPPPVNFIVPYIETVHNRIPIEIMRGCTRGCRFCHAGMISRPVRERPVQEVITSIESAVKNTGFEEIGLLSLSSSDYSHINLLVQEVSDRFANQQLAISLPSLRIETISVNLMEKLRTSRGGGFTLAPEAATEKMREIINKPIDSLSLLDISREIFSRGWPTLKLYFMIGHPSETLTDVKAISNLCKAVRSEGRKILGNRAQVHAGLSTFIPKPHTPFQWVACDTVEQIRLKQKLLKDELRGKGLKLSWVNPEETMIEASLSRGDRRLANVIYDAWKLGAKFDSWNEHFKYDIWIEAFRRNGIDPFFYTHRKRNLSEKFPWDHISTSVRKEFLLEDYRWSLEGKIRPDCREQCTACGVLPVFSEIRRQNPGKSWKCPEVLPSHINESSTVLP